MNVRTSFAAVLTALGVLICSSAEAQFLSPGSLSRDHASLEGDDHCSDCHSSGRQVSSSSCLNCHSRLAGRIRAGQGLHGRQYRGQPCQSCHIEHLGRGAPQIRWPGGSRDNFDHSLTGWPLRGSHQRQECNDCHQGRSFLGARGTCTSCHEDNHEGRFGTTCQDCHNERNWASVQINNFDHSQARFPLRGQHQQVECAGCHNDPPRYRGISFSTCASCHSDPHSGRYGSSCSDCHSEDGWEDLTRVRNSHPGLSLNGGHQRVTCARCHNRGIDAAPSRGSRCASCHQPVHEAPFGNNCRSCHGSIRWLRLPERIGRRAHARTPFPLNGAHTATDCVDCHNPDLPRQERFRELDFDECSSCHEDPHNAAFTNLGDDNDCATCHDESAFAPSQFNATLHARTEYALEGRHEVVACVGCHELESPRLNFEVSEQRCIDCHENPHGNQFAAEMRDGGCTNCHNTSGWDRPNIDHSTWPLTGAHALAACDSCHEPSDEDRQSGQGASYRGVPRTCAGCHTDIHAGQFRLSEPNRNCTFCHSTREFEIDEFDHENLAGYVLAGQHQRLECEQCHGTEELRNGSEIVRYRLGYDGCADCHANPHQRRRGPGNRRTSLLTPGHPDAPSMHRGAPAGEVIFARLLMQFDQRLGNP